MVFDVAGGFFGVMPVSSQRGEMGWSCAANTPSFMRWRRVGESNEETRER